MKSSWNKIWGPPGTPVHRISQPRILERAFPPPENLPDPGTEHVSYGSCIAGGFLNTEPKEKALRGNPPFKLIGGWGSKSHRLWQSKLASDWPEPHRLSGTAL